MSEYLSEFESEQAHMEITAQEHTLETIAAKLKLNPIKLEQYINQHGSLEVLGSIYQKIVAAANLSIDLEFTDQEVSEALIKHKGLTKTETEFIFQK